MQTYELTVVGRSIRSNCDDLTLVRTSVGVDRIHVMFDNAEWLSFPVTATFSQDGMDPVTTSVPLAPMTGGNGWYAEGYVKIPYEAIRRLGPLRVTFQGTDSSANHIVTAFGEPLVVEREGDSADGDIPSDAPTIDQWNQAYADAVAAVAHLQEVMAGFEEITVATGDTPGLVMPDGTTIAIEDGVLSATYELPVATEERLGGVIPDGTTITVDQDGTIHGASAYVLPVADVETLGGVIPDGVTVTVDDDGTLRARVAYTLPKATDSTLGGVMVGDGLECHDGLLSVATFTDSEIEELTPMDGVLLGDEVGY